MSSCNIDGGCYTGNSCKNVYKGKRYVPKIIGTWDNTKQTKYESLSVVTWEGNSYTSKKDVPSGIDIANTNYWVITGNYNAQVENYRQEVEQYKNNVIELCKKIELTEKNIDKISKKISEIEGKIKDAPIDLNFRDIQAMLSENNGEIIVIPQKNIVLEKPLFTLKNNIIDYGIYTKQKLFWNKKFPYSKSEHNSHIKCFFDRPEGFMLQGIVDVSPTNVVVMWRIFGELEKEGECVLQEYNVETGEKLKEVKGLMLYHCNDGCSIPSRREILLAPQNDPKGRNLISVLNYDLTFKREYFGPFEGLIGGIAHDEKNKMIAYLGNISTDVNKVIITDMENNILHEFETTTPVNNVFQSMTIIDNEFISLVYNNYIKIYNYVGVLVYEYALQGVGENEGSYYMGDGKIALGYRSWTESLKTDRIEVLDLKSSRKESFLTNNMFMAKPHFRYNVMEVSNSIIITKDKEIKLATEFANTEFGRYPMLKGILGKPRKLNDYEIILPIKYLSHIVTEEGMNLNTLCDNNSTSVGIQKTLWTCASVYKEGIKFSVYNLTTNERIKIDDLTENRGCNFTWRFAVRSA